MDPHKLLKYAISAPRYTSYPAANHFTAEIGAAVYERWLRAMRPDETLSLYFHVPFCRSLCWFCGCNTTVVNNPEITRSYAETLETELRMLAEIVPSSAGVRHIHWGGGTPSEIGLEPLRKLMRRVGELFQLAEGAEIAMEVDPRTTTPALAGALAELGFNRISLGVQDIDPKVQAAVNRIQPIGLVERTAATLREVGIADINIDLMVGLPHQSVEGVARSVAATIDAVSPDRVAVFPYAHVPWMKMHQRLIPDDALPGPEARLAMAEIAAETIASRGYVRVGLDHFARPAEALAKAKQAGTLRRNFQGYVSDEATTLIGLGASAISSLPDGYVQNHHTARQYRHTIEAGRFATARGFALGPRDRARREVIEKLMCYGSVDLGQVADNWDMSIDDFRDAVVALAPMVKDGLVEIGGDRVALTVDALPLVRSVCTAFDEYYGRGESRHTAAV